MLIEFNKRELAPQFDVVIIDEAQDLSWLQWKMVERIAANSKRVYIAGDDDQAIFTWAGARPDFLMNMDGSRTVLNKSYRLPQLIHDKANQLIKRVKHRVDKEWSARSENGQLNYSPEEQLSKLKTGEWLVLARNNYRLDKLEEELKLDGHYYMRNGKTSISQRVFNAIMAWENLRKGKELSLKEVKYFYYYLSVGENVERNHKTMQRADVDKMYDYDALTTEHGLKVSKDKPWFEALADIPRERSSYVRAILRRKEKITKEPRIKLSTIHGSKGGEADNVMLLTDLSRKTDEEYWKNKDLERRVFYVGMTRARNTLTIVRSQSNREFSEAF